MIGLHLETRVMSETGLQLKDASTFILDGTKPLSLNLANFNQTCQKFDVCDGDMDVVVDWVAAAADDHYHDDDGKGDDDRDY